MSGFRSRMVTMEVFNEKTIWRLVVAWNKYGLQVYWLTGREWWEERRKYHYMIQKPLFKIRWRELPYMGG